MKKIILASQSPRRYELMKLLNIEFEVIVSDAKEVFNKNKSIEEAIIDVAYQKAHTVYINNLDKIVIGVDSIVYQNNKILNKPKDYDDAYKMIKSYSNNSHRVISGVSIISKDKTINFYSDCYVYFDSISDNEIKEYLKSDEYKDKAGAYAIQGLMSKFIKKIDGDYYSVMGFPINKIYKVLKDEFLVF